MSVLNKIAFFQNERSDIPNQILAKELAGKNDRSGIQEIVDNLSHQNKSVQSDCLKVLYEIGYFSPELIADNVNTFLNLLTSKNNRMVWGTMIALATIAPLKADDIWKRIDEVVAAVESGSVITVDAGVRALGIIASKNDVYCEKLLPFLFDILRNSIPRDVPRNAECIVPAINLATKSEFLSIIEQRKPELKPSQLTKLNRILKKLGV